MNIGLADRLTIAMRFRWRTYARLIEIEHTVFSLPVAYAGAWMAEPRVLPADWGLILVALFGARTAAMALNRWLDRDIDAQNPRTAQRELPAGKVRPLEVYGLIGGGFALFAVAAALLSPWCLILAPIPAAVFWIYPQMKRWTPWTHLGVGSALAFAPLGGFLGIVKTPEMMVYHPHLPDVMLLSVFVLAWVAGFDVIYAMLDVAFDRAAGLYSIPACWGEQVGLRVARLLHVLGLLALVTIHARHPTWTWTAGVAWTGLCGLFMIQHAWAQKGRFAAAFFQANAAVGFAVFALIWTIF